MGLFKKEKYYTLKQILSVNAQYNIIIGERSNGKTFACLMYAVEQYYKYKKETAYIRREDSDYLGRRAATLCDNLVSTKTVERITKGEWTHIYYYSSRWYLCRYDEKDRRIKDENPFMYAFSLNTSHHDKSTSYPNINTIIFDEFLTNKYYLTDEFVIFQNLLSTIIRQREDVKIFMLGNTVNKYGCPYVSEMGLKHLKDMKQGTIDTYTYGDSKLRLAVEYCKPNENGKPNDYYFAFNNPKLKMITGGVWEMEIYPHLPEKYKPKDVILHFFIQYSSEWLHGEVVLLKEMSFIFLHAKTTPLTEKEKYNTLIFSPEYNPLPNWNRRITEPRNKITKKIAEYLYTDKIFYSTNDVGEIFSNYLTWCTQE